MWKRIGIEVTQGGGTEYQYVRGGDAKGLPELAAARSLLSLFLAYSLKKARQRGPQSDKEHYKRHERRNKLVFFNQRKHAANG